MWSCARQCIAPMLDTSSPENRSVLANNLCTFLQGVSVVIHISSTIRRHAKNMISALQLLNVTTFTIHATWHYSDVIMSAMASWITGVSIVCSTVCSDVHQRNIKAARYWPLWGESTGDRWIPLTKGQWGGKCFPWWRHHVFTIHTQEMSYATPPWTLCV